MKQSQPQEQEQKMNKIILVGEAASGKTYIAEHFEDIGISANLSVTTRPMRDGEEHMKSYNFMSNFRFNLNRLMLRFWEVKSFNGWKYGTLKSEWKNKQLFIFTPSGVETMSKKALSESSIFYIEVPENTRRERLMQRSDSDTVDRRINADRQDFTKNSEYKKHHKITSDGGFNVYDVAADIIKQAQHDYRTRN